MLSLDLDQTRIEIPTDEIIVNLDLIEQFNAMSTHITNRIGTNLTTWHFDKGEKALKAIQMLQETEISYRWIEEKTPALILQYGFDA